MINRWLHRVFCAVSLFVAVVAASAQQTDFNEVGSKMLMMLRNTHFERLPYNDALGRKFLDDYLSDLDFQRLYFTQQDVDQFSAKYGGNLHVMISDGQGMPAALEIYSVFRERVKERVTQANELLEGGEFDFTKDEFIMMSRKEAAWPKDEADAKRLWKLQIKEAVLAEILRRDMVTQLAKEQGKPDPGLDDRDPKKKVALRYKRFLASVEDVDSEEVANYFLSAVSRAYDPHTDYMSYREMSRFTDGMKNQLVGIGALLQAEEDGATKIIGIVVGGPADREGTLKLNDRVVAVDTLNTGKPEDMADIMFMKIDKVVDLIRGQEGAPVALKVEPAGSAPGETKMVVIPRGKVEMKDDQASAEIIDVHTAKKGSHRLGVITLPSFYSDFNNPKDDEPEISCAVDVERMLTRLNEEKIDGLILDLRGNGGGSLEEVCRMTGFFMDRGPVVQVKNALGQVQVKETDNGKPIYTGPMVVLIDKSSASASEILAGALQDFNRAVIVGESSTFGKGTVQSPMDIASQLPLFSAKDRAGSLKVTIQKFYRPSGSSTQMDGVKSDIAFPGILDALEVGEAYLGHSLPHDRIRNAPNFNPSADQALFIPRLKELSQKRVNECKDFSYVIQDVIKTQSRIKANRLSLNKAERAHEIAESDAQQKTRNAERRERFKSIQEQDKKRMSFHKITLDDLDNGTALKIYDPSIDQDAYIRRAKDETADLDDTPEWPSGLDPVKRESLSVLRDLVELTDNARMAGIIK